MLTTAARLLQLLSLLQQPREWTGAQLAERLEVTARTVRNDVERLRSLGYPVHATPGVTGGYRLGSGALLPPLLLDDEEATAVAIGLRTAAGGTVTGIEEASLRALTKLERVLPARVRHRVESLHEATISLPHNGPVMNTNVLTAIASAIRTRETLRFDYESHEGAASRRNAEPHRLVHTRGRWYLVAWDADRADWRTFRADRIVPRTPNGPRFEPREIPGGDLVSYLQNRLGTLSWRYRTRATVHAPAEQVTAVLPPSVLVESIDEQTCHAHVGSDNPRMLALWLGMLDADFEITDSPELADELRKLSDRYARAARPL